MKPRWQVVSALGIFQILAWGSSFYLPAVLAAPIAQDTSWPLPWIIGGLSIGLLTAAFASPCVGRLIGHHGGKPVLAIAAVLLASGLAILGMAPVLPVFLLGWLVMGLGMGMGLYDPAFATLGRLYAADARPAITTLTLWGGFASTVCWPLSAYLVTQLGWRGTCLAYAALHLTISLPLLLVFIPPVPARQVGEAALPTPPLALARQERRSFLLLAALLVTGGMIMGVISVHLLTLLQARGVALASAVSFGALVGPSQVGARLLEMAGRGRHHPLWTLTASLGLVTIGIGLLALGVAIVPLALILYGAGQGIYSIARGTVPLALFGSEHYAGMMGRLARPALVAQAIAPLVGAFLLTHGGADALFGFLAALTFAGVGLLGLLWRSHRAAIGEIRPVTTSG